MTTSSPWSIQEIIGPNTNQLLDPALNRIWFWQKDADGRCLAFNKRGAIHHFVKIFLPYWGFYKYRVGSDGGYLIIQKNRQRVRIIGHDGDKGSAVEIFEWFQDQVPFLKAVLGHGKKNSLIPQGFDEEVFAAVDLFTSRTLQYLPKLKVVEYEDSQGKTRKGELLPLQDTPTEAFLPFENGIIHLTANKDPAMVPWSQIPANRFIWDREVRNYRIKIQDHPSGAFWEFLKHLALEEQEGNWKPNLSQQDCLVSAVGYLCHNYQLPDKRPCVIFYDRTNAWKSGGNGKSLLCTALQHVRPVHEISGKHLKKGDNQFAWAGYTPEKRVVVIQDIKAEFQFDSLYNQIEDAFTVEEKGKNKVTIPREMAPKIAITTNHTVDNQGWSDARRQHLVPISTYYGSMNRFHGKNVKDILGQWLYLDWSEDQWNDFYNVIIHCLQFYLDQGLSRFDDEVYQDRLMLAATSGNEELLQTLKDFINDVVSNHDGETTRSALHAALNSEELESLNQSWSGNWQTRCFKRVAESMGYQINAGRREGRWQQKINGKTEDCFKLTSMQSPVSHSSASKPQDGMNSILKFFTRSGLSK